MVGISGRSCQRVGPVTARPLMLPALICGWAGALGRRGRRRGGRAGAGPPLQGKRVVPLRRSPARSPGGGAWRWGGVALGEGDGFKLRGWSEGGGAAL